MIYIIKFHPYTDVSKYLQKLKRVSEDIAERDDVGCSAKGGAICTVRCGKKKRAKKWSLIRDPD